MPVVAGLESGTRRIEPKRLRALSTDLRLVVSDAPLRVLARVVAGSLTLPDDADVSAYLGKNPWSDPDAYRREVYDHMQSRHPADADRRAGTELVIPDADLPVLNIVLADFYECYSGGRPWTRLRTREREAEERLAAQLP